MIYTGAIMPNTRKVSLFMNGASQAVRLPADFRFSAKEIYASRDEATGNVTLSANPGTEIWDGIFARFHAADVPADFMKERPMNHPPEERDIFGEEQD
jgi:antitoxin VapB